jgi:hypothetical protein
LPKPKPFTAESHYRSEYYQKTLPFESSRFNNSNSDGTNGVLGPDGLPIYQRQPDTRDFSTETRSQYVNKQLEGNVEKIYGPDDCPPGVDPKAWQDFVSQNGPMPL